LRGSHNYISLIKTPFFFLFFFPRYGFVKLPPFFFPHPKGSQAIFPLSPSPLLLSPRGKSLPLFEQSACAFPVPTRDFFPPSFFRFLVDAPDLPGAASSTFFFSLVDSPVSPYLPAPFTPSLGNLFLAGRHRFPAAGFFPIFLVRRTFFSWERVFFFSF